jgi:hypothetical protein
MAAVSYHHGVEPDQENRALLSLAGQFREAALRAGRADVVAKIDDAILLLASPVQPDSKAKSSNDKANAVLRILDGLGF